jgi:hypothetical protein
MTRKWTTQNEMMKGHNSVWQGAGINDNVAPVGGLGRNPPPGFINMPAAEGLSSRRRPTELRPVGRN